MRGRQSGLDVYKGERSIDTENKYVIYSNMNENETETNRYNWEEVMDELPDYTLPVVMEDCVSKELDDINQNDFIEENETCVHYEEGEILIDTEN